MACPRQLFSLLATVAVRSAPVYRSTLFHHLRTTRVPTPAASVSLSTPKFLDVSFHSTNRTSETAAVLEESPVKEPQAEKSQPQFDSVDNLHPATARSLQHVFGYETMTDVQAAVLANLPRTDDMLIKAKTGTGKTLAFLIPAIESLLAKRKQRNDKKGSIIVVSPTRELAMQIAVEARKVTKFHDLHTHVLVGGMPKARQVLDLKRHPADIIVGTPGRLLDMQMTCADMDRASRACDVLVLDEADVLLEMGFRENMEDLISKFPTDRQTLLFSATVSKEIKAVAGVALKKNFTFLDLVSHEEANVHLHVPQRYALHNLEKQPELVHRIIISSMKENKDSKIIVFLPTTKMTTVYAQYLRLTGLKPVLELHSGKSQGQRTRVSDAFRRANSGVLVTSDVSARGVDYPNVTLVLQVFSPMNREQYIHRIGRTGRAGKSGQAMIILTPWEQGFLDELRDLPIELSEEWSADAMSQLDAKGLLDDARGDASRAYASKHLREDEVHPALSSLIGYFLPKDRQCGFVKHDLPDHLSDFCSGLNMSPPAYSPVLLSLIAGGAHRRTNRRFGNKPPGYGGGGSYRKRSQT